MDRWEMIHFYRRASEAVSRSPPMLKYHEDRMLQSTCKPYSHGYSHKDQEWLEIFERSPVIFHKRKMSHKNQEWLEIFERSPVIFHKRKMLQRSFTILLKHWTYQMMKNQSIRKAILNYSLFYGLWGYPHYYKVKRSSAGIQGWLGAGPHKL
jgi:hypothetical protein